MASTSQVRTRDAVLAPVQNGSQSRHRSVHILFAYRNAGDVERSVRELKNVGFRVSADVIVTPEQFTERLSLQPYDLVVAEYPSSNWEGAQALDLLHVSGMQIPLIFIGDTLERGTVAELITRGAYDCIETDHISHLPVAVRRALDEAKLRGERDQAEKMLKHSEAKYSALIGNPTYGICRCSLDGKFLDVNQTLLSMLGYTSREELLAANLARDVILDPATRAQMLGQNSEKDGTNSFDTEWKGKNGTSHRVRMTGREVRSEHGATESYEVIVEDVTKQRALEDQLRRQAMRDALTGLANYRQFVDALNIEIKRSKRTGREFALVMLDLNGLKLINDRYGHPMGNNALCRLADALCICSRDIDTAARFGGDEFALILPEAGAGAANVVARRVCHSLANDAKTPRLFVSMGIAIYPRDGGTIEHLLRAADRALYKMKDDGKVALQERNELQANSAKSRAAL